MKIDLSTIDHEQFMVHPHIVYGETMWLIQPAFIGCKWRQSNKHFRSSIWNVDGELVSAGFPKFTNWGENPDNFPVPETLRNVVVTEKMDGSLLIVSKYKGNVIIRTRGTIDASGMENGHELLHSSFTENILYKLNREYLNDTWEFSFLFEWTSPVNRIVIRYGDLPTFTLVGVINHTDYTLWNQEELNDLAEFLKFQRPDQFDFSDISELLEKVDLWEGKEGVVVYSKNGQALHKIKSAWYLVRHRLKEEFGNFEKILDFYISEGCPSFSVFQTRISEVTDWETAGEIIGDISNCVEYQKEVKLITDAMNRFVNEKLIPLGDPKDKKIRGQMAQLVLKAYGDTNRASFVFKLLDGKQLDADDLKKLFYQVLKK